MIMNETCCKLTKIPCKNRKVAVTHLPLQKFTVQCIQNAIARGDKSRHSQLLDISIAIRNGVRNPRVKDRLIGASLLALRGFGDCGLEMSSKISHMRGKGGMMRKV